MVPIFHVLLKDMFSLPGRLAFPLTPSGKPFKAAVVWICVANFVPKATALGGGATECDQSMRAKWVD
jgi:hypothetical protein